MSKAINVKEEDLTLDGESLNLDEVNNSSAVQQMVCGHLEVVTTTNTYFEVKATQNGRRFRFVFSKNGKVTAMSGIYSSIAGNKYSGTARPGHNVGIQCIS